MNDPAQKESAAPALKVEQSKEIKLPTGVLGLDVAPDGKMIFAACIDGGVFAVNAGSGAKELLGQHESFASGVHLIPNARALLSGGYDGALHWHDLAARKTSRKVAAHQFWSWQSAVSRDGRWVGSVTGQYLCGGYKYEPLPEREPSVRIYDATTGQLAHSLPHVPSVQAIAFSGDSRHVAAGNLMGEVRVWELATGKQIANWTTPSFTGWGIIKGHYYTGGIYALSFAPGDDELFLAGMGSTTDPAAGNGRQLWQRFHWRDGKKLAETNENDSGRGLMETLAFHPGGKYFVMAGRLENGKWSAAFFNAGTGALFHSLDTKSRVTKASFSADGTRLFLGETLGQEKKKDGKFPEFGRIRIYNLA